MTERCLIDTNILVYSYEESPDIRCAKCQELVLDIFDGKVKGVISNQVLAEFFRVMTTKIKTVLTKTEASDLVKALAESPGWGKINYTHETVRKAAKIAEECNIKIWDAIIAATMRENDISTIYTENEKDFGKIPGLKVINPLKS